MLIKTDTTPEQARETLSPHESFLTERAMQSPSSKTVSKETKQCRKGQDGLYRTKRVGGFTESAWGNLHPRLFAKLGRVDIRTDEGTRNIADR